MNQTEVTDHNLVTQYQNGDYKAFEIIYRRYRSWTIKILIGQGINADDACDICQEIFLSLLSTLKTFDNQSGFKAYLNKLLRNKTIDHYRKNQNKIMPLLISAQAATGGKKSGEGLELCSFQKQKDEFYDQFELDDLIRHCLRFVKSPRWQSMILLWLNGHKQKGIAKIMGMPIGSISSGLARAKVTFIECINQNLSKKKDETILK